MAREVFYRKFRSQSFADIVGQEPVTRTLRNAVRTGRLSHAYLFCGPRGVGKTSAARVLAKAVNCENSQDGEPCNQCRACRSISAGQCLDVLEIDAASNRRIEEMRDIREKVGYTPTEVRMKFYILDEAHMLTMEACNALLKTLEEPPPHVIFVLSTTDAHRLPATVLSRCQRFDFRRIPMAEVVSRLRYIGQEEGLEIEPSALEYVARLSTGSLRDAESLLDQLVSYCGNDISLAQVQAIMGTAGSQAALQLASYILRREPAEGLRLVNQAVADGTDLVQLGRSVLEMLRGVLLIKVASEPLGLLELGPEDRGVLAALAKDVPMERLLETVRIFSRVDAGLRNAFPPQLPLEMAVVEATLVREADTSLVGTRIPAAGAGIATQQGNQPASTARGAYSRDRGAQRSVSAASLLSGKSEDGHPAVELKIDPRREKVSSEPREAPMAAGAPASQGEAASADAPLWPDAEPIQQRWADIVRIVSQKSGALGALLAGCEILKVEGNCVVLGFRHDFHRQRVDDAPNRRIVEEALVSCLGQPCRVQCVKGGVQVPARPQPAEDLIVKSALAMGARIKNITEPGQP